MKAKLVQCGDDLAVVIDKSLREQMEIDLNTQLDMVADGRTIIIMKRDETRRAMLQVALEEMDEEYGSVFQKLAE